MCQHEELNSVKVYLSPEEVEGLALGWGAVETAEGTVGEGEGISTSPWSSVTAVSEMVSSSSPPGCVADCRLTLSVSGCSLSSEISSLQSSEANWWMSRDKSFNAYCMSF